MGIKSQDVQAVLNKTTFNKKATHVVSSLKVRLECHAVKYDE